MINTKQQLTSNIWFESFSLFFFSSLPLYLSFDLCNHICNWTNLFKTFLAQNLLFVIWKCFALTFGRKYEKLLMAINIDWDLKTFLISNEIEFHLSFLGQHNFDFIRLKGDIRILHSKEWCWIAFQKCCINRNSSRSIESNGKVSNFLCLNGKLLRNGVCVCVSLKHPWNILQNYRFCNILGKINLYDKFSDDSNKSVDINTENCLLT